MSTFSYLGTYALSTNDDLNYAMEFFIPSNCSYRSTGSSGQFCIAISLKSGQTQPNTNFIQQNETYTAAKSGLTVQFEQPDQNGIKRPTIVIT